MLTGISFKAYPNRQQKIKLSQWMGCARFIWNAKCADEHYLSSYAKKYLPQGTYPKVDQKYSQYKTEELSFWLSDCPSPILRNAASNWFSTYQNFLKGLCGKPNRKRKSNVDSIHLTNELFRFERCSDGVTRLFIGSKKNHIGYLSVKLHASFSIPKSIRVIKKNGDYRVSFSYDDGVNEKDFLSLEQHFDYLKKSTRKDLEKSTVGIDRGVKIPIQAGNESYDYTEEQKKKKRAKEKYIKRCQNRLARQKKGSKRRNKVKKRLGKSHEKIANIRKDFCHKSSRKIVDNSQAKILVFEDLKTCNMTRKPKAVKDERTNKWKRNGRRAKAGLNRSILDKGWHQVEAFVKYKAKKAGKAVFKVSAYQTSQECADCGHTYPDNRKTQELFFCENCGHSDNADHNAAEVIKKRAINLIMDSGTELSKRGVLLDIGRGAVSKTRGANANHAHSDEVSKKKRRALVA